MGLDGVLCASAEEASIAACRAAYALWPQVMKNAQEMTLNEAGVRQSWVDYDWEQLLEHRSSNVSKLSPAPPWLLYKVQQLRPACRAEWELIVFARLCVEEAMACRANRAKGRAGARPLTVGEIESNWSESCGLRSFVVPLGSEHYRFARSDGRFTAPKQLQPSGRNEILRGSLGTCPSCSGLWCC